MTSNYDRQQRNLRILMSTASDMLLNLRNRIEGEQSEGAYGRTHRRNLEERNIKTLENDYHDWYTEAFQLIKQIIPDRLEEFKYLYMGDGTEEGREGYSYKISHWLLGYKSPTYRNYSGQITREFSDAEIVFERFRNQALILQSALRRFDSSLFNIKQVLQAELLDSELESARELARGGFTRPAGSLAGVVLEKHLRQIVSNHNLDANKRNPTIGDFNNVLKDGGVLDTPSWRQVQRLSDLRNLCAHSREREPTKEEVDELIDGVEKYTKTLF